MGSNISLEQTNYNIEEVKSNNQIMNIRPTWDEYFKQITYLVSTRSSCEKLHVGCLFVKDNRIIAQGYNGYITGCEHKMVIKDNHNIGTIHAEQNAITDCAKRGVSCNNSTAYITHFPCLNCTKMLCAAGIKNILYINDYNNDEMSKYFCKSVDVKLNKLIIKEQNYFRTKENN